MAASDEQGSAAGPPGLFERRLLLEIEQWECKYTLGLSPASIPPEYRFQGGLFFGQDFEIEARVIAPRSHRNEAYRIRLSPVANSVHFGPDGLDEVGRIYFRAPNGITTGSSIMLFIPEATMATVAICLAHVWRYLDISTFDESEDEASVSAFSFARDVHENLIPWVSGERS